jgi:hypothetical protein
MILLLSLSRLIERVQFSLSTAFWCSLIGHVLLSVIAFLIGFAFAWQPAIGAIIAFIIGCVFLSALFQIAVCAKNGTFTRWRAVILSLIVILGDLFIASPLIELWKHFRT